MIAQFKSNISYHTYTRFIWFCDNRFIYIYIYIWSSRYRTLCDHVEIRMPLELRQNTLITVTSICYRKLWPVIWLPGCLLLDYLNRCIGCCFGLLILSMTDQRPLVGGQSRDLAIPVRPVICTTGFDKAGSFITIDLPSYTFGQIVFY